MSEVLVARLKDIIATKLDLNLKAEEIDAAASLFEDGLGLDSMSIVEFIVAVEENLDIKFLDSELDPQFFKNLTTLGQMLAQKLAATPR